MIEVLNAGLQLGSSTLAEEHMPAAIDALRWALLDSGMVGGM